MHARGSVVLSTPPSFKLDVADGFHNHWHVKSVFLKDMPATGVRIYNYFDDGAAQHGRRARQHAATSCCRIRNSGAPLAIVDEHWSYAIRSTAAAALACKWVGPRDPKVLGLVGVGTMGLNALRCLLTLYRFDGDPLHLAPAGDAGGLRARSGRRSWASRWWRRIRSRRWCAAPTSRSAAPPRATS